MAARKTTQAAERTSVAERLLDEARAIIADRGLATLGVRELVAASECSPGSLYYLFGDLDGVIVAVNRDTLLRLDAALDGAARAQDARSLLRRLADGYLAFAVAETRLLRALFEHRMRDDRPFPAEHLELVAATFSRIEAALAPILPHMDPLERSMLARTLFSAAHGIVTLGLEQRLVAVPLPHLSRQLGLFVEAIEAGLETMARSIAAMSGTATGNH